MPPKAKSTTLTTPAVVGRKVQYPSVEAYVLDGDKAMTAEQAKELLGWEEVEVKDESVLLTDRYGNKVRCTENLGNRPYDMTLAQTWMMEVLKRHWRLNGETIIIGRTGTVISGQHRLTGLVLAAQEWERQPRWQSYWPDGPPTMECVLIYGIDESDTVVNTVDTGKPRNTVDVLCRAQIYADRGIGERKALARITEYAVRMLWDRTGAKEHAHAIRRTHTETFEYLANHPKVKDACVHIFEENKKGKLADYYSLGYSAGMLYLMGSSTSDGDEYRVGDPPTEATLNWDRWNKACEFWSLMSVEGPNEMRPVRHALKPLADGALIKLSSHERQAIIVKAWLCWVAGQNPTEKRIALQYHTDDDGIRSMAEEHPLIGGIDLGPAAASSGEDAEEGEEIEGEEGLEDEGEEPTPEEIEERKAEEKARRIEEEKVKEQDRTKKSKGKAKAEKNGQAPNTGLTEQLAKLHEEHPDRVLLFVGNSTCQAWAEDADVLAAVLGKKAPIHADGMAKLSFPIADLEGAIDALEEAGQQVCICQPRSRGATEVLESAEYLTAVKEGEPGANGEPAPAPKKAKGKK
jgi:hypothetical protein